MGAGSGPHHGADHRQFSWRGWWATRPVAVDGSRAGGRSVGGVNGGEVEIITGDDGTNPEQAVSEATRLVDVEGVVPAIDEAAFREAAEGAKEGCPVSKALQGNVELSVTARLAGS